MALIEMTVRGIGTDASPTDPQILLRDMTGNVGVDIWIGTIEAFAIQLALDAQPSPRPVTHELMANALAQCGVTLVGVTINDVNEETYYASLHLQNAEGKYQVDARPSDAIALALRMKAPILVSEEVAQKQGQKSAGD